MAELSEHFDVSIDTVRRDLDQLHREGALIRTHGGAVSATDGALRDRGLDVRLRVQVEEKEKIARLAAEMVDDGAVVMLNAGTTTLAVARALRGHRDLTIATNNLRIPGGDRPVGVSRPLRLRRRRPHDHPGHHRPRHLRDGSRWP